MPEQPPSNEPSRAQPALANEHEPAALVSTHLEARAAHRRVLAATSLACVVGVCILVGVLLRHGPGTPLGQ